MLLISVILAIIAVMSTQIVQWINIYSQSKRGVALGIIAMIQGVSLTAGVIYGSLILARAFSDSIIIQVLLGGVISIATMIITKPIISLLMIIFNLYLLAPVYWLIDRLFPIKK